MDPKTVEPAAERLPNWLLERIEVDIDSALRGRPLFRAPGAPGATWTFDPRSVTTAHDRPEVLRAFYDDLTFHNLNVLVCLLLPHDRARAVREWKKHRSTTEAQ